MKIIRSGSLASLAAEAPMLATLEQIRRAFYQEVVCLLDLPNEAVIPISRGNIAPVVG